jgi:diguanylate cyclase (GGDEF)-like protein
MVVTNPPVSLSPPLVLVLAPPGALFDVAREAFQQPEWNLRIADPADSLGPFLAGVPDVVVVDGSRAGRLALDWLREIRGNSASEAVPLVLVLGADAPEVITAAYGAGASDVLVAPVELDRLLDRVTFQVHSSQLVYSANDHVEDLLHAQRLGGTGSWTLESKSGLMHWSPEAERLLGVSVGSGPRDLDRFLESVPEEERRELRAALEEAVDAGRPLSVRHRMIIGEDERWLEQAVEPVSGFGEATGLRATMRDVTMQNQAEATRGEDSTRDPLTGLPSRPSFFVALRDEIERARDQRVAVLYIDIDGFRSVKHSMGHAFGDRLLEHLAAILRDFAPGDHAARISGDEFAILVRDADEREGVVALAERLQAIINAPAEIDGRTVTFTVSIGVAVYPMDGSTADELLQSADLATHHAKQAGRSTIESFRRSFRKSVMRRFTLEGELRHALARDEVHVEYQPRVLAESRVPVGVEALVRWVHPALGRVSPAEFIPIAEETGMIGPLGKFVLEAAAREMAELRLRGLPIRVSVNVSSWQFAHTNIWDLITATLRATELPPDLLEIEITESLMVDEQSDPDTAIRDLQAIGVRVALDDFGTGYSSLASVARFPLDVLKLDRSIVRDLDNDPRSERVAAAVIELAHGLDMEVVGEGVDNDPQAEALRRIGCDELQGFLFSPSLLLDDLEAWLREGRTTKR